MSPNDNNIVFCGKIIPYDEDELNEYRKRDYLSVRSSSFHKSQGYLISNDADSFLSRNRSTSYSNRFVAKCAPSPIQKPARERKYEIVSSVKNIRVFVPFALFPIQIHPSSLAGKMENPAVDQLPEADSLPDGFVNSTVEPLAPSTPTPEQEKPLSDYKEEELIKPDLRPGLVVNEFQLGESRTQETEKLRTFPVPLYENQSSVALQEVVKVPSKGCLDQSECTPTVPESGKSVSGDELNELNELSAGPSHGKEQPEGKCQSSEKSTEGGPDTQAAHVKEISSPERMENNEKVVSNIVEMPEVKRKNAKRAFKSEKEFLEFTLKYQQVLTERDAAIAVRDKLESLCRELQRQNKMLMDDCKRVSAEGQNLRLDISTKFQDAIKDVSSKLEEQKDEFLSQLKENEMLRNKLKAAC
ncbi:hypothetical protein F0562_031833 [Nyssa sinensis]|uniref:Uncharacterized protein n=1 Tax=Nyssa sinensis TaxID=561372 RepID=A0A5J5AVP8_9ASTE|nr:hypothetical protein F0562_031833 [Nyssa sinensis]